MTKQYPYSPSTFGDLDDDGYQLTVYCGPCQRQVTMDLAKFPRDQSYLARRYTCSQCGRTGQGVLSPGNCVEYRR